MASTYPLEIVEAARWSKEHPDVKGDAVAGAVQSQTWDPSVKSLCAFPTVLAKMNEKIDWTQKLGDAFLAQQKEVMQAVQVLRNKAKETGNLKSTKEVTVKEEPAPAGSPAPQTIIIESPDPEVVYVPTYNPTVVYGAWAYPYYPPYAYYPPGYAYGGATFWSFTAGVIVGGAIWGNCNWGGNDVDIDINRQNNFNRNEINANRNNSGNRTRQQSRDQSRRQQPRRHTSRAGSTTPTHRKGVGYKDSATQQKFGKGAQPAEASQAREQYRGHAEQGRQQMSREGMGNQRDMAGNSVNSRDAGGASTRDIGGGSRDAGGGSRDMGGSSASTRDMGGAKPRQLLPQLVITIVGVMFAILEFAILGRLWRRQVARARVRPAVAAACRVAVAAADVGDEPGGLRKCAQQHLVLIASLAALTALRSASRRPLRHPKPRCRRWSKRRRPTDDQARCSRCSAKIAQTAHRLGRSGRGQEWRAKNFSRATTTAHSLDKSVAESVTLEVGADKWPFPIPDRQKDGSWHFDSAAGAEETHQSPRRRERTRHHPVLPGLRRCAARVLPAQSCRTIRFCTTPTGSSAPRERRMACTGPRPTMRNRARSAKNSRRRVRRVTLQEGTMKGVPFHGYIYRLLTQQGPNAPGGAYDYLVNDKLLGGFALIAFPAEYGNSGVMTFIVNHDGVVYSQDLGPTRPSSPWRSRSSTRRRRGSARKRTNDHRRTGTATIPAKARRSAPQHAQQLFELHAHLLDDLLALAHVDARFFAAELVARTTDREALLVEQRADLANDDDVLALVVAAVAAALHRLELREFLLPVTQHVRLHAAELAHFADREIALAGDRRQFVIILWFQHKPRLAPSVSDLDETSPRVAR